jgi:hypothetical protein
LSRSFTFERYRAALQAIAAGADNSIEIVREALRSRVIRKSIEQHAEQQSDEMTEAAA